MSFRFEGVGIFLKESQRKMAWWGSGTQRSWARCAHLPLPELGSKSAGDARPVRLPHGGGSLCGCSLLRWVCARPKDQGDGRLPGRGGKELTEMGFLFLSLTGTANPDSTRFFNSSLVAL